MSKDFDDYFMGQATGVSRGSIMGDLGVQHHRSQMGSMGKPDTFVSPKPGRPLFPWLDDLFERVPRFVGRTLVALGILAALVVGVRQNAQGAEIAFWAIGGAIGGALILPLIKVALKLILFSFKIALIAAVLYGIHKLIVLAP